ncbi:MULTISPECIES: hypothetical protein [Rhodovulum]
MPPPQTLAGIVSSAKWTASRTVPPEKSPPSGVRVSGIGA